MNKQNMNNLAERMLDHARLHETLAGMDDEQSMWMADLIAAAEIIRVMQEPKARYQTSDIRFFIDESEGRI